MRVALVNNFFFPRPSGSAHHTERLAAGLASLGHDVLVLTSAQGAEVGEEKRDGYRVVRLRCWTTPALAIASRYKLNFALSPHNLREIFRLLDEFNPDVVHQHGQVFDLSWMTGIWVRSRRRPAALTVHTALLHTVPVYAGAMRVIDAFVKRILRIWKPRFIAVDVLMRDYVSSRYGVKPEDIAVIPLGVELGSMRSTTDRTVRNELGLGDRPVVLSLGHVTPLRSRLLLVESLPSLLAAQPDAVLLVVGNVYDDRFLKRAEELGVTDHVVVTGQVPFTRVASFVASADIECHEEGLGNGLGLATLEAMAAGAPVVAVASPNSFVGITLRNWKDLVLVEKPDAELLSAALAKLLGDPDLATSIGEGCRRLIADHFTTEISTESHLRLYEQLIDTRA